MKFLMAGGGTGGHVIPALAVARELRRRGHDVFFVGTARGMEAKLVPAEGFALKMIEIGGLNRVGARQKIATLAQLPITTLGCRKFVRDAGAIFSMGGYVAGPPVMAGLLARKPVVVMEPNAIPGFTNRVISRFVARALINFPETARYFPRSEHTGLPVRDEFFRIAPRLRGEVLHLLITGGSQGSRTLNRAARESWPLFRNSGIAVRIVHQAGKPEFEALHRDFSQTGLDGEILPFIADMPGAFSQADLVICRSGAGTVSELAAAGRPSILVPFPFSADDHQTRNAQTIELAGGGSMVRDADMNGEKLYSLVRELSAGDSLARMGDAVRRFAKPGAAERAAGIMEEVAGA